MLVLAGGLTQCGNLVLESGAAINSGYGKALNVYAHPMYVCGS